MSNEILCKTCIYCRQKTEQLSGELKGDSSKISEQRACIAITSGGFATMMRLGDEGDATECNRYEKLEL